MPLVSNINFIFPDIAIGIADFIVINNKMAIEGGIALYHINEPKQSLTANDAIALHQKINLHTAFNYIFNTKLNLICPI